MKRQLRAGMLAVAFGLLLPAVAMATPTTTKPPTITPSGTPVVGTELTCNDPGTWKGTNPGDTVEPIDFSWYYSTAETNQIWDGTTYTPGVQDIGHKLVCIETVEDTTDDSTNTAKSAETNAVAAGNPPTNTQPPTISGVAEVGNELVCNAGSWNPGNPGDDIEATDYSWYNGGTLVHDGQDDNTYTPKTADIGDQLVCKETEEDFETGGTAVSPSTATDPVLPEASITITRYSPAVSGNIGESVAGVSVTVALERLVSASGTTTAQVATATVATDSSGAWTATLSPGLGFGASGDVLTTTYAVGTAPTSTTLPANDSYTESQNVRFEGEESSISDDGSTVTGPFDGNDCSNLSFVVDGSTQATTPADVCTYTASPELTDNNHVQASYTEGTTDVNGVVSSVTAIDDVGLLGTGTNGPPTCTADLVFDLVTCSDLNTGNFTVSRNSGSAVDLETSLDSGTSAVYSGSATVPGLTGGDTVALNQVGITRTLSTLHVGTLRIDVNTGGDITGGSCQTGELLTAINFGGTGGACPANGTMSSATAAGDAELDDLSGDTTEVNPPSLTDQIPSFDAAMPGGLWTSYADVNGNGDTADTLAAVQSVNFQVVPHDGGTAVINENMTPGSDSVGPFESGTLTNALAAGRYFANWLLTDSHGDTVAYSKLFAQETGPTGPTGPQGSAGAQGKQGVQGPQGPAGTSSEIKCTFKTTGKGKKKKTKETCNVSVLSPGSHSVSVDISRGKTMYASGSAAVRNGVAHLTLRSARAIRRGRYLVTIVTTKDGKATITRSTRRL